MTAQNRQTLKALFETGDTITQSSMSTLIDSFLDIAEISSQTIVGPVVFNDTISVSSLSLTAPLPVNSGGTGRNSATPFSVICGGTTTTAATQSVDVSAIPAGYVLTFTSAGGIPAWQPNSAIGGVVGIANGGTGATTAVSAFSALKQVATTAATGVVEKADITEVSAETADKYPDSASLKYSPGVAKAWVSFNGTVTPITMSSSYNVAAVSSLGTGLYRVNFINNLASGNFVTVGMAGRSSSTDNATVGRNAELSAATAGIYQAVNYTTISVEAPSGTNVDASAMNVLVFGVF